MKERNGLIVDLVGCGGIGTWLLSATIQALHSSPLPKRIGGVVFVLHDSDVVEERNLHHQAFSPSDVGSLKVRAIRRRLSPFLGPDLGILAHPADVRGPEDLSSDGDVVVVAVDSPVARRAVHRSGRVFLDLRVSGDSAVLLDSSTDPEQVRLMTPDHPGILPGRGCDRVGQHPVRALACSLDGRPVVDTGDSDSPRGGRLLA